MERHKRWVVAFLLAACCAPGGPARAADRVSAEQVREAVRRGVASLRRAQGADGTWQGDSRGNGATALVLLAMYNAGVGAEDPQFAKGLAALGAAPSQSTYEAALRCQLYAALAESQPPAARADLQDKLRSAADYLIKGQLPTGMWTYTLDAGAGDNSNTQFALLGLHEAAKAGAKVPREIWVRAVQYYHGAQGQDGGWGYVAGQPSYGSMTAAGVASLFITGEQQRVAGPKIFKNGAYPSCGRYLQNTALTAGMNWLTKNFSVTVNPGKGATWLYYYLYGLERTGMIAGQQNFGKHDWYREGAAFLVADQRADGSWGGASYETAFCVLFLAKGNRPVLIEKLQWPGQWNRNIHDLENLTAFIDYKLGKRVSWQTVELTQPLQELRQAPILYLTGHECPTFNEPQKEKLRQFIATGGTLVAEACCGSQEFATAFRQLAAELYPEYPLRPLSPDHAVFSSYYKLSDTYGLEGINVGCRTSVFFAPKAMSCLWELQTIPEWSEKAFTLGTNLAAYATGRETLGDKLDTVSLPELRRSGQPATQEVPRGGVRLARLFHEGDYDADPKALVRLAEMLKDQFGVDVVTRDRKLRATDEELFEYPVLFMTGHFRFELSDAEVEALRLYLRRGGVLLAEACCGQKEFDEGFRKLAGRLFPDHPLSPLPVDHPIYTGQVGVPLDELRYRAILADELGVRGMPIPPKTPEQGPLERVELDGRTVILYSRYDYSCGLEGDNPFSSRGYVEDDARKLAIDVFLYAIAY